MTTVSEEYRNNFISKKQAEKDKLEFAIEQLKECTNVPEFDWQFSVIGRKIKNLQQQLSKL